MKTKQLTGKQICSVRCPTCGAAAGKRCILVAGGPRNEPHGKRKCFAAETVERKAIKKRRLEILASVSNEAEKKVSDAVALAQFKRALAGRPILTKSVKEKATKEQLASWNKS
jgi:hypothetical protein